MAELCTQCGAELRNGIAFCTNCGAKAEPAAPVPQPKAVISAEKPVSTGTYFGLMFLFSLPVLGALACLIMAFASKNQNIRNFSRAMLIWLVIALVLGALAALAVNALIGAVTPYLEEALGQLETSGQLGSLGELAEALEGLEGLIPTE